jgi:putative hydrolase of the HAD superfamily
MDLQRRKCLMGKIKAVTLDLWQTLLLETPEQSSQRSAIRMNALSRQLSEFGIDVPAVQLASKLQELDSWLSGYWELNKEVHSVDQIAFLVKRAASSQPKLKRWQLFKLCDVVSRTVFELPPLLNPEAKETLQRLKESGIMIGLISNVGMTSGLTLRELLQKNGVQSFFDAQTFSDEIGVRKPNSLVFHITLQQMKSEPQEAVHVGDDLIADFWGAKMVGLKSIHFSSNVEKQKGRKSAQQTSYSLGNGASDRLTEQDIIPDRTTSSLLSILSIIKEF